MNNRCIIYPQENGIVAILVPSPDCKKSIEEIAAKGVPQGVPYKIISKSDVPSDRTFRNAWEYVE